MPSYQSAKPVSQYGSRHPKQIAYVRVGIGVFLLLVAAGLYRSGHGGGWEWLLVVLAGVHFCLAYRLVRIAGDARGWRKKPHRRLP